MNGQTDAQPYGKMDGKELAALQGLFAKLPRSDRLMLLLHYADELTPAEIGAVLETPVDAVTRRLDQLRRMARLEIAGLGTRTRGAADAVAAAT